MSSSRDELEEKILSGTATEKERLALEQLLEHHRRVDNARNVEIFIRSLGQIYESFREELKAMRRERHAAAGLLLLQFLATAVTLLAAYILSKSI